MEPLYENGTVLEALVQSNFIETGKTDPSDNITKGYRYVICGIGEEGYHLLELAPRIGENLEDPIMVRLSAVREDVERPFTFKKVGRVDLGDEDIWKLILSGKLLQELPDLREHSHDPGLLMLH